MSAAVFSRPDSAKSFAIGLVAALAVFLDLVVGGLRAAELTAGAGIAAIVVIAAARRPAIALGVVVVFVPLQVGLLSFIYRFGVPTTLVKDLGYIKDAMTLGICLAAVTARVRHGVRRRFGRIEWFAVIYVGIATLYLIMPSVFPGSFGGQAFTPRLNAWRLDCLFVVLLIAVRHTPLTDASIRRLRQVAIGTALVLCGIGLWEFVAASAYNHFLTNTLQVPRYQTVVLHSAPPPNADYAAAFSSGSSGGTYSRIGSLILNPLDMGFYVVVPFALALDRMFRVGAGLAAIVITAVTGLALVLTETRSAVLGGGIAIVCCLAINLRRSTPGQVRAAVLLVIALALAVPLSTHSTIRDRFNSITNTNSDLDNSQHLSRTKDGWHEVINKPQGLGLGANPASGSRYGTTNLTTTENSYLQVASELGIPAALAFIGLYLSTLVALYRRAMADRLSAVGGLAAAMWFAGTGLLVAGLFLQVWIGLPVSLTFWGLAGAALGRAPLAAAPADAMPADAVPAGVA